MTAYPCGMTETPLFREMLGRVLRIRRLTLGLTLREVAERSGVSVQYLSEVERGLKDPSSEMIAAIAGALQLPLAEVLVLSARLASAQGALVPQPLPAGAVHPLHAHEAASDSAGMRAPALHSPAPQQSARGQVALALAA